MGDNPCLHGPFAGFFVGYREARESSWSASTAKTFLAIERTFLDRHPDVTIGNLTRKHITRHRDYLMGIGRSPRTIRQHIKYIRSVLESAVEAGEIDANPARKIKLPAIQQSVKQPFTLDQFKALLQATDGEWHDLVLFAGLTGQRLKDCLHVLRENIGPHTIRIFRHKNKDWHTLPCHSLLLPLRGRGLLVPHLNALPLTGSRSISAQFRDAILPKIGISQAYGEHMGGNRKVTIYSFHSLRHMLSTELNRIGASPETRMAILGHEDAQVSKGYTHADMDTARRTIDRLLI